MRKLSVDRFDGTYCICQDLADEKMYALPLNEVPREAKEGDILAIDGEGVLTVDREETDKRRAKIAGLQNRLFKA